MGATTSSVFARNPLYWLCLVVAFQLSPTVIVAFQPFVSNRPFLLVTRQREQPLFSSSPPDWDEGNGSNSLDSNQWQSSDTFDESSPSSSDKDGAAWQETIAKKKDGRFWNSFLPEKSKEGEEDDMTAEEKVQSSALPDEELQEQSWLDQLAALSAEEVEFNLKEADRADKARQMEEWGFDAKTIESTLEIAVDSTLETVEELEGMQSYREGSYDFEDVDLSTVESHAKVDKDPETGESVRSQMVYVDEHTCIGCTNCAMIAQSTFFMHDEHGRARVFNQWGDDDETIQIAIETCPVDCIHYVPYDELVRLEVERRDQNINFKARLVSQGEYGGNQLSHRVGGPVTFTAPQKISGNMGSRCNNCPTRGCKSCPMYGVGKNPEYERKEKLRLQKIAKMRLQDQREQQKKSAEL